MLIKNKKGFTLVELLAVIVILAIIMVIALPAVMTAMNNGRKNAFKVYAQKVLTVAIAKNETERLDEKTGVTCYTLPNLMKKGLGSFVGYVMVDYSSETDVQFSIVLADGKFYIPATGSGANTVGGKYAEIDSLEAIKIGDAKKPDNGIAKITSTCPEGTTE